MFINLEYLNIENTNITTIPKTYNKLKQLYGSGSFITKLSKKLYNLENIIINNTNIKKIKYYKNLNYLNCNNTFIEYINIDYLTYLICNNTLLINFLHKNLNNNLIYLNCSNTNIKELPNNLFNLIYLNCSNTLIKKLSYKCFNKLIILYASNTILEYLPENLNNLNYLDISYNKLIKKIPNEFSNLKYLNISNTYNIKKISKKIKNLFLPANIPLCPPTDSRCNQILSLNRKC